MLTRSRNTFVMVLLLLAVAFMAACSWLPGIGPSSLAPSDAVSYQITGTGNVGNVIVSYTAPISTASPTGVISPAAGVALPFSSGAVGGYSQFVGQEATITATATGSPVCMDVYVLINAEVKDHQSKCGSQLTVTAKK